MPVKAVVMPEERVVRRDPREMSMTTEMPGFGRPKCRQAQKGGNDRAKTDTPPTHDVLR